MRRSPLLPIFLIVLVDVLALTILIPLLPFYAQHHGASPFVYGVLLSVFAVCQFLSGPPLGALSDRYGRRRVLLLSQLGTFVGLLLLAYADSLALVFVARIIEGATAGNLSVAQAYVSDVTSRENRAKGFALIGVAFGVGFVIGPGITALLSPYGIAVPILGAAAMSALSILATWFLLPDAPPPAPEPGAPPVFRPSVLRIGGYLHYLRRPLLGRLLGQFFLFSLAFSLFTSGFALFAERRFTWNGHPFGEREVAVAFIYVGALGVLLQGGLLGRLVARFGERRLVIAGFLLSAIGYAGLGAAHGIAMLGVVAAVSSAGSGVLRPSLTSEVTHAAGRHEQGAALGLTQSLFSLAMIISPLVGNALIDAGWLGVWAGAAAAISAAGFALALSTPAVPIEVEARQGTDSASSIPTARPSR